MGQVGKFSQEFFLCPKLDILNLWGKFSQNGAKWNLHKSGGENVAKRENCRENQEFCDFKNAT